MNFVPTQVIAIVNRSATNAARAEKLLKDIQQLVKPASFVAVDITGINRVGVVDAIERHAHLLSSTTLICVCGGDGTVSVVASAIVSLKSLSASQRKSVVLPLWGGNANDLAIMLNGPVGRSTARTLLDKAQVVSIYSLRIVLRSQDDSHTTYIATCYASFGITAHASWLMDKTSHAHAHDGTAPKSLPLKILSEQRDFWTTAFRVEGFKVIAEEREEEMFERIFIKGPRIARISRIPVRLSEPKYFEATARRKGVHFFADLFKTVFTRRHGTITDQTHSFIISDATMAQIDGEIIGIPPHTHVEVGIHSVPLRVLSRKRQP